MEIREAALAARKAARILGALSAAEKNKALKLIAEFLQEHADDINAQNQEDLARSKQEELAAPLLKRLKFDHEKIMEATTGLDSLISLEDPAGKTLLMHELDENLELYRISCPLGVIGVIFESRPDALVQIAGLCLKSGNALLLKGGSEAQKTNRILADLIIEAGNKAGLPSGWIYLLETREDVQSMLALDQFIDLLIPRGSNEFVKYIMDNSAIPVLGHADGVCHMYLAEQLDPDMAIELVIDSKTQYTAVCNALETLLIHESHAGTLLAQVADKLQNLGVKLYGCERTCQLIECEPVLEWHHEYLDSQLSIKIVNSLEEAIEHINQYGSGHTESIVTSRREVAEEFMLLVDSGNVFWNCSTRFSDGFRYGFGAEVGVSTSKIHARGPVGLEGLMTYKYKLLGKGHLVADYASGKKKFNHKRENKPYPLL